MVSGRKVRDRLHSHLSGNDNALSMKDTMRNVYIKIQPSP